MGKKLSGKSETSVCDKTQRWTSQGVQTHEKTNMTICFWDHNLFNYSCVLPMRVGKYLFSLNQRHNHKSRMAINCSFEMTVSLSQR